MALIKELQNRIRSYKTLNAFCKCNKIRYSDYEEEDLIVLNYEQSAPPGTISDVCRGLILNKSTLKVVCRGFDRFGCYDIEQSDYNIEDCKFYEKIDGSLIKIYFYKKLWRVSNRSQAFAENLSCSLGRITSNKTFAHLVYEALEVKSIDEFQTFCNSNKFVTNYTYIFELTSIHTTVITPYNQTKLWFLAARDNCTGQYLKDIKISGPVLYPKTYRFESFKACQEAANVLSGRKEGFVVYNACNEPIAKIKSRHYKILHKIKGNVLDEKRICNMIINGKHTEFLEAFPSYEKEFEPYIYKLNEFNDKNNIAEEFKKLLKIESEEQFLQEAFKKPWAAVAYVGRKLKINQAMNAFMCNTPNKAEILLKCVNESSV